MENLAPGINQDSENDMRKPFEAFNRIQVPGENSPFRPVFSAGHILEMFDPKSCGCFHQAPTAMIRAWGKIFAAFLQSRDAPGGIFS